MGAQTQTFREWRAAAPLDRYLSCVWVQRVAADAEPYTFRTIPNGSADVVCRTDGSARVVGPRTGPDDEVLAPGTVIVGIRLRPGMVRAVLGLPADELVDESVELTEVWGRRAARLAGVLAETGSPATTAAALEAAVAARLSAGAKPDPVVVEAVRRLMPGRSADVAGLPALLSVSERRLRRLFAGTVGVAPKVLQRILRFQSFLALACTHERRSARLAQLAADSGFADQPHLTREAARLAGRTPHRLLVESERVCAGAHDHSLSYEPLLPLP